MRRLPSSLVEHPCCRFSTFPFPVAVIKCRRRHFHVSQRLLAENQTYIFCTIASRLPLRRGCIKPRSGETAPVHATSRPAALVQIQNRNVLIKSNIELLQSNESVVESLSILIHQPHLLLLYVFSIITSLACNIALQRQRLRLLSAKF